MERPDVEASMPTSPRARARAAVQAWGQGRATSLCLAVEAAMAVAIAEVSYHRIASHRIASYRIACRVGQVMAMAATGLAALWHRRTGDRLWPRRSRYLCDSRPAT